MAESESRTQTCPTCQISFVGKSCPECAAAAAEPTKIAPVARLFKDALQEKPGTRYLKPGEEFSPGDIFHGLEIIEIAGRGGMGAVYKARQPALDRLVALKILPADKSDLVQFQDRFHREAKTLASLSHPNIIGIHDFGEREGIYFFVMEYVDGMDLHDYLAREKPGMRDIRKIFGQVCEALQYAHRKGVVHRDIKPANILIDGEGLVKIADFGLAKITKAEKGTLLTDTGAMLGTAHYMAPEQMNDALHVDHRADLYSMGIMLYQMLTGEIPMGKVDPPSSVSAEYAPFDPIIERAMEKKPGSRYQNASELKEDVEAATSGLAPLTKIRTRKRGGAWVGIVAGLILLAGGYLLYQEMSREREVGPEPALVKQPAGIDPLKTRLSYATFTEESSAFHEEARSLISSLTGRAREDAFEWLRNAIASYPASWPREDWLSRKQEAEKILRYCDLLRQVVPAGEKTFDPIHVRLKEIGAAMEPVAAWKGTIDLKIIPSPYAEVRGLKIGEEWVTVEGRKVGEGLDTPATLQSLEIASYILVLFHPELGEQEIVIPEEELENGRVYAVSGSLGKPDALRLGIAP